MIDADALKERAIRVSTVKEHCYMRAVGTREIDKAPTVDAVAVTRCADCQHCALEYTDQGFGYPSRPTRVCIIHDHETKLDDYCSWAKRKDEGK